MNEYFLIDLKRGIRRAVSGLRMRRADRRTIPARGQEIRLFLVVRNETLRLPYFFTYYRRLGVDRFLVVDNASTDGTLDWVLAQPDAHVFSTRETYTRQEAWVDHLLRRYGAGGWCVVVDVDELFLFPGCGGVGLRAFCRHLDQRRCTAVHALLLDLYPEGSLSEAAYLAGADFLTAAAWFDPDSHHPQRFAFRKCRNAENVRFAGGVRERVFGLPDVCCTKFPLVKFGPGMFLRQGTHAVEGATLADVRGVSLHFKFFADFNPRVAEEAVRGEHWNGAVQYKAYARKTAEKPDLRLWNERSVRYESPEQLLRMGLMKSEAGWHAQRTG